MTLTLVLRVRHGIQAIETQCLFLAGSFPTVLLFTAWGSRNEAFSRLWRRDWYGPRGWYGFSGFGSMLARDFWVQIDGVMDHWGSWEEYCCTGAPWSGTSRKSWILSVEESKDISLQKTILVQQRTWWWWFLVECWSSLVRFEDGLVAIYQKGKGRLACFLDRSRVRWNSGAAQFSDGIPPIAAIQESRTDVSMLIHANYRVTRSGIPIRRFTSSQPLCKMTLK